MTRVNVTLRQKDRVLSFEADKLETSSPWMFWNVVALPEDADRDSIVENLQASNARWDGHITEDGTYILNLPPIFELEEL